VNRLAWLLRRRAEWLALTVGASLIAAALLLHHVVVQPLAQRVQTQQAQRTPAREGMLDRLGDELARADSPRAQLTGFYGHFERDATLTERLARVHAIARGLKLELTRADYKLTSTPERRLDRYQMVLPIEGAYPTVRRFILEVLRQMPTLALESIQFQRKEVGEGAVGAQITFVFFIAK
jgi:hypothetical protein